MGSGSATDTEGHFSGGFVADGAMLEDRPLFDSESVLFGGGGVSDVSGLEDLGAAIDACELGGEKSPGAAFGGADGLFGVGQGLDDP